MPEIPEGGLRGPEDLKANVRVLAKAVDSVVGPEKYALHTGECAKEYLPSAGEVTEREATREPCNIDWRRTKHLVGRENHDEN